MVVKSIIGISLLASFAAQAENLASKTYKFLPQHPVSLENPLPWYLEAHCSMITDKENMLYGVMKKKKGSINGKTLKQGESMSVLIKNNEMLHIGADAGAKIEIVNNGESLITAVCWI